MAAPDDVLRAAVDANGGWLFKHTWDGIVVLRPVGYEQRTLQRVAVFSGGFNLSGAVAVCADDGADESNVSASAT